MQSSVHCSTIYNNHDMEATQMSINKEMNKEVVHTYNGIYSAILKKCNNAIFSNMNGPRDDHGT